MARRRSSSADGDLVQPAKRTRVAAEPDGQGQAGQDGQDDQDGQDGQDGENGENGQNGQDKHDDQDDPGRTAGQPGSQAVATRTRTRPVRAAAAAGRSAAAVASMAAAAVPPRDRIHERLFAPVTDEERKTWQGWTEIESEPAFFNFILRELGVRDATIHELFGVDEAALAHLPTPLGLIFLYRFVEDDHEAGQDCPDDLWFANQTTANACGTVAMLNIAMNCARLRLGGHLARFQAATQPLHPALRGHLLSTDPVIRAAHNTFARRLDMLVSDLALRLAWADREAAKKKAAASRRTKRSKPKTARAAEKKKEAEEEEAAFHFIAYVPRGRDVWELNGMQEKPLKLGSVDDEDDSAAWTAMACSRIAARMAAYAQVDDAAVFSLLALCHTPDRDGGPAAGGRAAGGRSSEDNDNDAECGSGGGDDDAAAAARRGDYTPAVHCWLKALADKGVLRRLATGQTGSEQQDGGP